MILNLGALRESGLSKGRGGKTLQQQQRACKSRARKANAVLDVEQPRCKLHRSDTGRKSGCCRRRRRGQSSAPQLSRGQQPSACITGEQCWQWEEEPSPSSGHVVTEGRGLRLKPAFLLCCTEPSAAPVMIAAVPLHHLQVETEQEKLLKAFSLESKCSLK